MDGLGGIDPLRLPDQRAFAFLLGLVADRQRKRLAGGLLNFARLYIVGKGQTPSPPVAYIEKLKLRRRADGHFRAQIVRQVVSFQRLKTKIEAQI